ncbi:MAG: RICIN domain-containing protein [Deltaproteobacteria bacterium]|nr:MAG: RICIN domain-containing protein [Deltaproteobacteria bacterium]
MVAPKPGLAIGCVAAALCAASCGDNLSGDVPELEPVDTLFVVAHLDDDMIFMQPELRAAIDAGSMATVYVSSGDATHGRYRGAHTFKAARVAYGNVAGSTDWDCRYVVVNGSPLHHCQLHDRLVSMVGLDTVDGGVLGDYPYSPLHLMEATVPDLPIVGRMRGSATKDSIIDSLFRIITVTQPRQIHTLDLAATHGHDHSGHMFTASFVLWAAARARYDGAIRWHRGYNVENEPANLGGGDDQPARSMLGYFEACYYHCGRCGTSCPVLQGDHEVWLHRQYSSTRAPLEAQGGLALADAGGCVSVAPDRSVMLGDCSTAATVHLDPRGYLMIGDRCLASGPGNDDPVVLARCADSPEQYWVIDSDGFLWNGRPPQPAPDMDYDHVRCLAAGATAGAPLTAPICGAHRQPHWQFVAR